MGNATRVHTWGRRAVAIVGAVASALPATVGVAQPAGALVAQPPWRYGHTMATDPATAKVVLFGGAGGAGTLDDTWTWNGTTWKPVTTATKPRARHNSSMAGDSATGTVVLFGGVTNAPSGAVEVDAADTWTWDGVQKTWTERTPLVSPSPRSDASMAYDAATKTVVLFGGSLSAGPDQQSNETWIWDGATGTWTLRQPPVSPPGRSGASLVYDPISGKVVLFGGEVQHGCPCLNDTWNWDGVAGTWTQVNPTVSPPGRAFAYASYHAASTKVVIFSGSPFSPQNTWAWDGASQTWARQAPVKEPCPRSHGAMAYHPATGMAVIFGGLATNCPIGAPDTWGWNGRNWKRLA